MCYFLCDQSILVNIQAFEDHLEDLHNPLLVELSWKARPIPVDIKVGRYEGEQQRIKRKVQIKRLCIGAMRMEEKVHIVMKGVG